MRFITDQLFEKYNYEPELNIHKGKPKDEETECKNFISELTNGNSIYFLILGAIIALTMIFVAIAIILPKDAQETFGFITFPICALFIIVFGVITYKVTKKCIKRIKLAKANGVFIKKMECTDKDIYDADEKKCYYFQFNNEFICKTNAKSFDLVSVGDKCTLVFIKGSSELSILGYVEQ